jgi:hypothetical protein
MRGSPDELEASWPGLSRLSTWFGALNVRARKGESFVPTKLCCGPPHVGPVLKRCQAWIAGTPPDHSPGVAMTARERYKSQMRKCPPRPAHLVFSRERQSCPKDWAIAADPRLKCGLDARLEAPARANTSELTCAFGRDSVESQGSAFNLKPTDLTETMTRRSPVGSSLRRRLPTCTSTMLV